jgi:protein phosphatase
VPELRGMGTTLTATVLVGSTLVAAHVGDTRLLLFRDRNLTQLTKDHTWVFEQVQYGLLSAEAARSHPKRHLLTRSLGSELIVGIDVLTLEMHPGDILVQCSDGIHGPIGEPEIAELVSAHPPEAAARALVRRAREEGGEDNISVQVAAVVSCPAPAARPWWRLGR